MNLLKKRARRLKRQGKLLAKKLAGKNTEGVAKTHRPSKDPSKSNHRRVVEQRVISGRLDMDNYRKVKH